MAATTDVARGVIGVGGGPYGLLLARSADYSDMFAVMRAAYPRPVDAMALHAIIQVRSAVGRSASTCTLRAYGAARRGGAGSGECSSSHTRHATPRVPRDSAPAAAASRPRPDCRPSSSSFSPAPSSPVHHTPTHHPRPPASARRRRRYGTGRSLLATCARSPTIRCRARRRTASSSSTASRTRRWGARWVVSL